MDKTARAKIAKSLLAAADRLEGSEVGAFGRIGEGRSMADAAKTATKLAKQAKALESALKSGDSRKASSMLGEIDTMLRMVRHALS